MNLMIVEGDLLEQDVDVIVNAWNRNVIPWWLLIPQGVSGAIKKKAGYAPFRELARHGPIPLGGAVHTGAGRLEYQGIIHVAGISMWWRSSPKSIRDSVLSAMKITQERGYASIALPIIGAGTGGGKSVKAEAIILETLNTIEFDGTVKVVRYMKRRRHIPDG